MATQYAFGQIVTNGLVLSLDAADRNSYVGSGTVWNDLTPNSSANNLINGPTFSSTNGGGSIFFDGTNDHASGSQNIAFPTSSQPLTIEAWVNVQETGTGGIFSYGSDAVAGNRMELGIRASNYVVIAINGSAYGFAEASNLNRWMQIVAIPGTLNSQTVIYKNSIQQSLVLQAGVDLTRNIASTTKYFLGAAPGATGNEINTATYLSGSISSIKLYNRSLSATEILQNYNAQKSRFGL